MEKTIGVCSLCGRWILDGEACYDEKRLKFYPDEYREWQEWEFHTELTCSYCLKTGIEEAKDLFNRFISLALEDIPREDDEQ
jgi:fibrillarin-like rRNA methylase